MNVTLIAHTPEIEKTIASAAKLCYSSSDINSLMNGLNEDNTTKFIEKLMNLGHLSPLEHATFTFGVEGISRATSHQLVRHRIASYSQKSQRYVDESKFEYIVPPRILSNHKSKELYENCIKSLGNSYQALVAQLINDYLEDKYGVDNKYYYNQDENKKDENKKDKNENKSLELVFENTYEKYKFLAEEYNLELYKKRIQEFKKIAQEDARYVLPNACETKIIVTMNIRSLLNFFKERCCNRAQWEIRNLANEMLRICKEVSPLLFSKAGASCTYGKCKEGEMSCGNPIRPK